MRANPGRRLARLSAVGPLALAIAAAPGPSLGAGPQGAGSLPIERVIGAVRCNLREALAATAKAHMRLTVTAVELHLSALQGRSGKAAAAAVEVPAVAPGVDLRALEAGATGEALPVSTHVIDIRFVPFGETKSGPACQADVGLLSVVRSGIDALSASDAGTDRLVIGFAADFLISRSQDDKIGFVFLDPDRETEHLAVHSIDVELQLDRT